MRPGVALARRRAASRVGKLNAAFAVLACHILGPDHEWLGIDFVRQGKQLPFGRIKNSTDVTVLRIAIVSRRLAGRHRAFAMRAMHAISPRGIAVDSFAVNMSVAEEEVQTDTEAAG